MNNIKRFRADHRHVVETEFDDAQFVGVDDFERVTAERDAALEREAALREELAKRPSEIAMSLQAKNDALQQRLTAADELNDSLRDRKNSIVVLMQRVGQLEAVAKEALEELLEMKRAVGFRGQTLMVVEKLEAALKPAEGPGNEAI